MLNKVDQTFGKTTDWLYKAVGGKMSIEDGGSKYKAVVCGAGDAGDVVVRC